MNFLMGIRARVLILTILPTIIISILLSVYFISIRLQDLSNGLRDRGIAILTQLAPKSEFAIFSANRPLLHALMNNALSEPEVKGIGIYDKWGKIIAHTGPAMDHLPMEESISIGQNQILLERKDHSIQFAIPVILHETVIEDFPDNDISQTELHKEPKESTLVGWIEIDVDTVGTKLKQYNTLMGSAFIVLCGLGFSGLLAMRMSKDVTRPILLITETVEKIRDGHYNSRAKTRAKGELYRLEEGINSMAEALEKAHDELQHSIDQATADLRETLETIEVQNIELELSRKEAEAASRVKSEFLANMSHEIRTPLNGVIGFIHLLAKTDLNITQREYVNTIDKSASSLMSIINDVLDFSKIEAGKLKLDRITFDIRDCAEDVMTLFAPNAYPKDLELISLVYEDVPTQLIGDALRIKQIMTNLVNNAIKFTNNGSVIMRVMVEQEDADNTCLIRISVSDTGIGLTAEEQKHIFKEFSQADTSTSRKYGGTGLGLVICKKLVEQMGGKVGLDSEPGNGSTFWFTCKVAIEKARHENHDWLSNTTVLAYMPHPVAALSLQHLLQQYGARVYVMSDMQKLFTTAEQMSFNQHGPIMALIDIKQRDFNSPMLSEQLTLLKKNPLAKIGVLANTSSGEIADLSAHLPVDFCISKPLQRRKLLHELLSAINPMVLNQIRIQDEPVKEPLPAMNNMQPENAPKILVVDDNPANLKLAGILLQEMGLHVTLVSNGFDANLAVRHTKFDLILMDIQMPDLDGIATTQLLRENPNGRDIPIIALTAHALTGEREHVLKAGMDDYLTKPVDERILQAIILRWLSNSQSTEKTTDPQKRIDWDQCLKIVNGKQALAKEMLKLLVESFGPSQSLIQLAKRNHDFSKIADEAHKLHGVCCYAGVPYLKQSVMQLEVLAHKAENTSEIEAAIEKLMYEIDKVIQESAQYLKGMGVEEYAEAV